MRATLVQLDSHFGQPRHNLERALQLMRAAAPADLVVLPELFPSGYTFADSSEVRELAEPADSGPTFEALAAHARAHQTWIAYGFAERAADGFYNSASVLGPDGLVGTYRKIHLFSRENLFFSPGQTAAPVYDLPIGKLGLMICFDWFFPEVARSLALRGAQVIVHPSNLVLPHCPQAMLTRSLENRVYSLTCDRIGSEHRGGADHDFIGSSQAVGVKGELLVRLSSDREETATVELDLPQADNKRLNSHNDLFTARRPELY
mgnify:CR=1 FL=1